MTRLRTFLIALKRVTWALLLFVSSVLALILVNSAFHFPTDVDAPLSAEETENARRFYTEAYKKPLPESPERFEYTTEYMRRAKEAAEKFRIQEQVTEFVKQYRLEDKPVLEIGSGRGYLQDVAQNYTGLDISPSVERFYHKKFVLGSATALPFSDDSFDGVWSIWVFEHVPNPEQALREARRVVRDKGVLFLMPAWNCPPWAADGYEVRPYSDFGIAGKMIKASIPLRSSVPFKALTLVPIRLSRELTVGREPSRLRYRRLTPNYEKYWALDSDAVNSIDIHEAMLWFTTRGDECLNCHASSILLPVTARPLIIRVHKRG